MKIRSTGGGMRRFVARAAAMSAVAGAAVTVGVAAQAPAAHADATCRGGVSIYGVLPDDRLTYSVVNPDNGNLTKVLTASTPLGFDAQAIATLNFNTVLVTSKTGALYRVDVVTNDESLAIKPPVQIGTGWTHDLLTYDGHGHLYGTADGTLLRYLVSQPKPTGPAHIGQRTEIGRGFTLKTMAAAADDRLIATTGSGELISYAVTGQGNWTRATLDDGGWGSFRTLVSPGGGLYYGATPDGAMYWYEDDDPADGKGYDIGYHLDDPVSSSGWTQTLLSAQPDVCTSKPKANPLRAKIARIALDEVGTPESQCDKYHPSCDAGRLSWCAMFATWVWDRAGVDGVPRGQFVARGLGKWGVDHGLFKPRTGPKKGSPKPGDWVIYGPPNGDTGGHVDTVVGVRPDGKLVVVGGNVSNKVTKRTIDPDTAESGEDGYKISGYVAPPGADR
jgi:hypothetical protein